MEYSPSLEANSCSGSQEILKKFNEPEGPLLLSQEPTIGL
jgi:hypothetical protein